MGSKSMKIFISSEEQAVGQLSISVNHNSRKGYNNLSDSSLMMLDELASLIEGEIGL